MKDPAAVFEALFSVLRNISHQETIQFTLAMLDEMLTLKPDRIADMHSPSPQHPGAPTPDRCVILARMLDRQDWFTQAKAANLLSKALKASEEDNSAIRSKFLEWVTAQFYRPSNLSESLLVASGALSGLLRTREARQEYARHLPLVVRALQGYLANAMASCGFEEYAWLVLSMLLISRVLCMFLHG
jgi:V-type H+-transporting ATPase subunit H